MLVVSGFTLRVKELVISMTTWLKQVAPGIALDVTPKIIPLEQHKTLASLTQVIITVCLIH